MKIKSPLALVIASVAAGLFAPACQAQDSQTRPALEAAATRPAIACPAPSTQPASQPSIPATLPADPAHAWLDRIDAQARQTKTLQADLIYDRLTGGPLSDRQRRLGKLFYEAGPPARFAVHFDSLLVDDRKETEDQWFIFDGIWRVERLDKEKKFIKEQIVAPDAPATQADPLALGSGPFAIPLSLRKDQILDRFAVSLEPLSPAENADMDLKDTVHLHLVPLPGRSTDFTALDMWFGRDSLQPVRVRTIDTTQAQSIIAIRKTRANEPVEPKVFDTTPPRERGWRVSVQPWQGP